MTATAGAAPAPATHPRGRGRRHAASPPPVILLGGGANAVSVARRLGRLGAAVHALAEPGALVARSRFCRAIDPGPSPPGPGREAKVWAEYLLGPRSDDFRGAVVLACSDPGIELIARHRGALAEKFLLDDSDPRAQLLMLNKLDTYREADAAGVPTPGFWVADSPGDLEAVRGALVYPLIVKPRLSHVFEGQTGRKLLVARDFDGLAAAVAEVSATGAGSLVVEMIPGGDDRLCSYYTYLDAESRPLFHFTKRIIRRYPALRGTACYHVTDDVPGLAGPANRLFRRVGLRGLANVEFKVDPRDGVPKLIECNARFTASNCLVARAGIDLAAFVYNRLTGRPLPPTDRFQTGLRLWDPVRDVQSYLELRRSGALTFGRWLASVLHRQTFPYFEWSDPMPALARLSRPLLARRPPGARAGP